MKLVTVELLRRRPGRGIVVPVVKADRTHEEGGRSCQGLGLTSSKRMAEGGWALKLQLRVSPFGGVTGLSKQCCPQVPILIKSITYASEMGWMPLSPQRRRNAPSFVMLKSQEEREGIHERS